MALNNPKVGLHATPEYQASGLPFVTGSSVTTSSVRIDFPKVTRAITVRNLSNSPFLYIGFTANGVTGSNRYSIPAGEAERFEIRCKNIFLMSDTGTVNYCLIGELTLIDADQMPTLTGSTVIDTNGGSGWLGVG